MEDFKSIFPMFSTTDVCSYNIYVAYIKNQKSHFYASPALVRLTYTPQDFTGMFFECKSMSVNFPTCLSLCFEPNANSFVVFTNDNASVSVYEYGEPLCDSMCFATY